MKIIQTACVSLALVLLSCATYDSSLLPPKSPSTTAAPGTESDCERACANGKKIGCDWAEPTPEGGTCLAVCTNAESSGFTSMHPQCLAGAHDCAEADACGEQ